MRRGLLAARLLAQVAAFLLLLPLHLAATRVAPAFAGRVACTFHRLFLRLFGIRVSVIGTPPGPGDPTLVLANHVSWLDIPVMASLLPLSFIAKHEIASWPVFGALARLQRCVFLDRSRKAATAEVNALVARRLAEGDLIVLFPEGTTGDGNRLLPFRSSLVGAARNALAVSAHHHVRLQPLAVAYRGIGGLPVRRADRPRVAWYGDMDLVPHALALLGEPIDVAIVWGEPIPIGAETDRKWATAAAESAVRRGIAAARPILLEGGRD